MANTSEKPVVSVVGVGASAGGVAALKELIPNLPKGQQFAYLVAQHLAPKHRSMLVDVLERETTLDVKEVIDGDTVLADTIYVTPANRDCVVHDGKFHLHAQAKEIAPRHSIDIMLSSLAESYGERSAGIILSGTGADGLHGILAIKTAGGVAIAQDPATTQYPGMPGAIIDAGLADLVLPPERIGGELAAIIMQILPNLALPTSARLPKTGLDALLTVLSSKSPFDFSQYKESTLARRVERRMAVLKVDTLEDYIATVEGSDTEAGLLLKEMLISVTDFFRDKETFGVISDALKEIVRRKAPGEDIRIWVPGCATGEEAYSIAILLAEALGDRLISTPVHIFASDVDTGAIALARQGLYLNASVKTVPEHFLEKYFTANEGVFQVGKTIRDMMVFARHDLMRDPPYINLDLVSCRNVLIYFKRPLQERLVPVFHYALNPGGYLVFGTSEGIGKFTDLFQQFVTHTKVYFKIGEQRGPPLLPLLSLLPSALRRHPDAAAPRRQEVAPLVDLYRNLITENYAPPGVLVNGRFEIVHVQGDVTRFVQVSSGDLNLNILNMVIPAMRLEARLVLRKAQRERTMVRGRPVVIDDDRGPSRVTPISIPATASAEGGGHVLLLFEESQVVEKRPEAGHELDGNDTRLSELEGELVAMREQLQISIEDLETSNEDLLSINEEYQSTAEELQSANEELQTSNEELQSSNEELLTVNDELKAKSEVLTTTNSDLAIILGTVLSGVMLLDRDLRVVRYSSSSKQIFDLWPASIGASLSAVGSPFDLTPLSAEMERAMRSQLRVERDLALGDRIFSVLLVPLRSDGGAPSGLVIAFTDETERKEAERESRRLATVVRNSSDAITIVDRDGRFLAWNQGAERMYGYTEAEALGLTIADLAPDGSDAQVLQMFEQRAESNTLTSFEAKRRTKDGRILEVWQTTTLLRDESGTPDAIAMTERDVSESKLLRAATENAIRANQSKSEFLARMSHDFRTPLNAIIGFSEVIEVQMFGPIDERRYVEYGGHIKSSGRHLLALVNDILDISKIEADEFELEDEVLDLRALAEESVRTLRLQAEHEGIDLAIDRAADLPEIRGDRRAIQQILINLLTNATNFTASGGQVTLGANRDSNGSLSLTVTDTGVGIDEKDIPTVLEPFGQLPGRLANKMTGVGLGLPIVKGLTAALGAEFDIASEVGKGTTVTIRFGKQRIVEPPAKPRRRKRKKTAALEGSKSA